MKSLSFCLIFSLVLFICSLSCFMLGIYYLFMEMINFIEWEEVSLSSMSVVMTMLFDWMKLIFMSFNLLISSMVIFYAKEYMSADKNITLFMMLVTMFVLLMM